MATNKPDSWWLEVMQSAMRIDAENASRWREAKSFYVHLDTNDQNIRSAFGIPPAQFGYEQEEPATFEELNEMAQRVRRARQRRQPPPPREIGRCTAAECGVQAAYHLRYLDLGGDSIGSPPSRRYNERVCLGHAAAILRYASERGVKLALFQLEQVTHMVPPEGGMMPCCGPRPSRYTVST